MTDSGTRRATLVGCGALALWSALALLTTAAGPIPPFQMTAMTFAIATALALAKWRLRGEWPHEPGLSRSIARVLRP